VFLLLMTPLAAAIALAGGIVALAPLLLILLPILTIGRAPGIARLAIATERRAQRGPRELGSAGFSRPTAIRIPGSLLSGPTAGRGPPLAA
jgi:hypothetical protein